MTPNQSYTTGRARRGEKMLNSSRDKNSGRYRSGDGGEEPAI